MSHKSVLLLLTLLISSAVQAAPQWAMQESIYEVNVRQFSKEGSLRAVERELPRIHKLGAKILWLMPIHPIGTERRKGSLGSPYSIKDYLDVNPELGTKSDLRSLISSAHQMGMKVLLDWVANHTAWDHPWTRLHPEFYTRDANGNFQPPNSDWHDVIDLNYDNPGLVEEMIRSMEYWVTEFDIDGFRCDVASLVPSNFWLKASQRLNQIKPIFMLAESESRDLLDHGFDALYGSGLFRTFSEVATHRKNANDTWQSFLQQRSQGKPDALFMQFSSNHDENTWTGDLYEKLGDSSAVFSVLVTTLPGIPLIYNGQEAGLAKRIAMFDKDPIFWRDHWLAHMYSRLFALKSQNRALLSGSSQGTIRRLSTDLNRDVLAFVRENGDDVVIVMTNLSNRPVSFKLKDLNFKRTLKDVLVEQSVELSGEKTFDLVPWGFRVFSN